MVCQYPQKVKDYLLSVRNVITKLELRVRLVKVGTVFTTPGGGEVVLIYTRSVAFQDSWKFYEALLSKMYLDYSNSSLDNAVKIIAGIPRTPNQA